MNDLNLGAVLSILCVTLATCSLHNQINPVKPDAHTPEPGLVVTTPTASGVHNAGSNDGATVDSTAPQGVPDTAAFGPGELPVMHPLALPPGETLRSRPIHPWSPWGRTDNCVIYRDAPEDAVSYRDGSLVRQVYWACDDGTPVSWVGLIRLTRYCGHPPSEIEVTYRDGRVERMAVPMVPCAGY